MIYHQSHDFLQDLSHSFHHWLNLFAFIIPVCLNNSWWCFSLSFSSFEDRRRVFFPPYLASFSSRFVILACSHPLIIILRLSEFFFTHPEQFKILFSLFLRSPLSQILFTLSFQLSFSKSYRCIIQYSLISSWSLRSLVSKFSKVSSFIS